MKSTIQFVAATILSLSTLPVHTQDIKQPNLAINSSNYSTAIGLRAGTTSGLTIKQFVGSSSAVEGIIGFWGRGLSGTVLFERYVPAFDVPGLNWYYGGGGHAAFHSEGLNLYYPNNRFDGFRDDALALGVDGILGLEYKIPPLPFALSLDLKPFLEVNTKGGVWMAVDPGLGVKVTF